MLAKLKQAEQEIKKGCNSMVKWSVGSPKQTGESGCGEDGIYCEVCQSKLVQLYKTTIMCAEDEIEFLLDKEWYEVNCMLNIFGKRQKRALDLQKTIKYAKEQLEGLK